MLIHDDVYIVRKNDNLWHISALLYGNPFGWKELAKVNGINDPTSLRTGTKLTIPLPGDGLRCHPRRYQVKKDDTYIWLATKYLGNSMRWRELEKLNPVKPTELRTGMELIVPADFRHP
ncbi:MAG: LysM peptidoglycan-binding domain-containing protein [Cyanobacteriota bacterium]|nr:LysM peptidoglycan-binding domain-containing protein [Cyanobacteriota bacterium]